MIKIDLSNFIKDYPNFIVIENSDNYFVEGLASVVDKDGFKWNEYSIRIIIEKDLYPHSFPQLFELDGQIPNNTDWHTFDDGSCCVAVRPVIQLNKNNGIRIEDYYKKFVLPYLANQTYRKLTGKFAEGEYAHGQQGIEDYYKELLNDNDLSKIKNFLKIIHQNKIPGRTSLCFCGSKRKYRHCHKKTIQTIQQIGIMNVFNDLKRYF